MDEYRTQHKTYESSHLFWVQLWSSVLWKCGKYPSSHSIVTESISCIWCQCKDDILCNLLLLLYTLVNFQEVPAAFVSFKSRFGAAVALHIQQGVNPTEWVTERAPEPQDVHWAFFSASFIKRWIFKLVVLVASFALIVLFLIPVVIVQGLANLDQLEKWFPFLKDILSL